MSVGRCAHCNGPVALADGRLAASCPCGRTTVPAEFFTAAAGGRQQQSTSGRPSA